MAKPRLELHSILKSITPHVYFQPSSNVRLTYPCIIYKLGSMDDVYANNKKYIKNNAYEVTLIYKDPDSELPNKLRDLEFSSFSRQFVSDNLYHDNFKIYF